MSAESAIKVGIGNLFTGSCFGASLPMMGQMFILGLALRKRSIIIYIMILCKISISITHVILQAFIQSSLIECETGRPSKIPWAAILTSPAVCNIIIVINIIVIIIVMIIMIIITLKTVNSTSQRCGRSQRHM